MQPPFPSPVSTWHNDTYDAISPTREELSCRGKTVVVTGAGSGIGREAAITFAIAGAKHVALVGRTVETLNETKKAISAANNSSKVSIHRADVSNIEDMTTIASEVGTWDIFLLNAGYCSAPAPIATADPGDYWKSYEVNVKSALVMAQCFVPTAAKPRAVVLGTVSGAMVFPSKMTATLSAYLVSKMALAKTLEYLAVENPGLFVASVHPGMVDTALLRKSGATPDQVPIDSAKLSAHFMLWLSSPEASELNGRLVWANWDVEELKAASAKIATEDLFSVNVRGWPFASL